MSRCSKMGSGIFKEERKVAVEWYLQMDLKWKSTTEIPYLFRRNNFFYFSHSQMLLCFNWKTSINFGELLLLKIRRLAKRTANFQFCKLCWNCDVTLLREAQMRNILWTNWKTANGYEDTIPHRTLTNKEEQKQKSSFHNPIPQKTPMNKWKKPRVTLKRRCQHHHHRRSCFLRLPLHPKPRFPLISLTPHV